MTSGVLLALTLALAAPGALPDEKAAIAPVAEAPVDIDIRIDRALELFHAKEHRKAAGKLFEAWTALPDGDLRRDNVLFHLARCLDELGLSQGAAELYMDVVGGRRAPELMGPALERLDALARKGKIDEQRLADDVLATNTYGELGEETTDFVEYHQALGDLRRGFPTWGVRRLEALAAHDRYYGWKARYALGVERLAKGNADGAEKLFRTVVDAAAAPGDVRNDARVALARQLYDRKDYEGAWQIYMAVDSPLPMQDVVLLERAWDRVAAADPRRALGMVVGLGAPVYRRLFAPERALINAMALRQLCQFRAAHQAVRSFRRQYGKLLGRIRKHEDLAVDDTVKASLDRNFQLLPAVRWRTLLRNERPQVKSLGDDKLEAEIARMYDARLAFVEAEVERGLEPAAERIAEEVLRIDEQLSIIDYEIGVGLFKSAEAAKRSSGLGAGAASGRVPYGSDEVYFKFTGEFWSDEINNFLVIAEDRCVSK